MSQLAVNEEQLENVFRRIGPVRRKLGLRTLGTPLALTSISLDITDVVIENGRTRYRLTSVVRLRTRPVPNINVVFTDGDTVVGETRTDEEGTASIGLVGGFAGNIDYQAFIGRQGSPASSEILRLSLSRLTVESNIDVEYTLDATNTLMANDDILLPLFRGKVSWTMRVPTSVNGNQFLQARIDGQIRVDTEYTVNSNTSLIVLEYEGGGPVPGDLSARLDVTPTSGPAPLAVRFDSSATGGRTPYIFRYDYGDGETDEGSGTSDTKIHTYQNSGNYVMTLEVEDQDGLKDSLNQPIAVTEPNGTPPPPGAKPVISSLTYENQGYNESRREYLVQLTVTFLGGTGPPWLIIWNVDGREEVTSVRSQGRVSIYDYQPQGPHRVEAVVRDNAGVESDPKAIDYSLPPPPPGDPTPYIARTLLNIIPPNRLRLHSAILSRVSRRR